MPDPIIAAARFINDQMRWLRGAIDEQGQPYAPHVFAEIDHCARRMRSIVDGPAAKKYLGPCGAFVVAEAADGCPVNCTCHNGPQYACDEPGGCGSAGCGRPRTTGETCEGDVQARVYGDGRLADTGRCATCGATVDTAARTAWLDDEVRSRAFRASEIEDAYGVNANLIRQWATEKRNLVQVHGHDRKGRALYLLSQVLDVARDKALERAERQAEKARRAAARAAESESVA